MCLEKLAKYNEIDGLPLVVMDDLRAKFPEKFNPEIYNNHDLYKFKTKTRITNKIYMSNLAKKKMDHGAHECFLWLKNNLLQSETKEERQQVMTAREDSPINMV